MASREDSCNRGIAFHFHHDTLAESCSDYNGRVEDIKQFKPKAEQSLRLRVFRLIPNDRLPSKLKTAYEIYDQAEKAYIRTWEIYDKAWEVYNKTEETYIRAREAYNKTEKAYNRAEKAYNKAREACDKAREARDKAEKTHDQAEKVHLRVLEAYMPQLEHLHKELCPDCPWNGQTIFTRQNNAGQWY